MIANKKNNTVLYLTSLEPEPDKDCEAGGDLFLLPLRPYVHGGAWRDRETSILQETSTS